MTTALLERIVARDRQKKGSTGDARPAARLPNHGRSLATVNATRPGEVDAGSGAADEDDAGLTGLQELAVAILVVAILVVGGLFAFGAFKGTANNSVGQQTAINTLQDAHGIYANNSSTYPGTAAMVTTLSSAEPGYTFANGTAVTGSKKVSISTSTDGQQMVIAASTPTGNCYYIVDNQIATPTGPVNANVPVALGTWYGYTTTGGCGATGAPAGATLAEAAWKAQW
jgi:hypothetical protein